MHLLRSTILAVLLALALAVGSSCASSGRAERDASDPSPTPEEQAGPAAAVATFDGNGDFYAVPDPLPVGSPGKVIRVAPADNIHIDGADVLRVMYHSRDRRDNDVAVTGIIAIPWSDPPSSGRQVVAWAHGTTGIGPGCAPSKEIDSPQRLATSYIDAGYLWLATDYAGLGPPGQRHAYLSGVTEARSIIDLVRAARQLPQAGAGADWIVYGHSQGGQAALFTGELAPDYAPELHLLGTVAVAPASPTALISSTADLSSSAFVIMALMGLPVDYPRLRPEDYLTEEGLRLAPVVDSGCGADIAGVYLPLGAQRTLAADPITVEPARSILAANEPGRYRTPVPIFIAHGAFDLIVPPSISRAMFERLCEQQQVITRTIYPLSDHALVMEASVRDVHGWIADRFAGLPAATGCP